MKKRLTTVTIIATLCIVILFVGCSKKSQYVPTQVENVSISITNVSPTGATVIVKDTNKEPYMYGEWYKIEKENNGKWVEVTPIISDYGFTSIGYLPKSNGEVEFAIDWEWLYGELPSGRYRLFKGVNQKYISIEFNVTNANV